MEQKGSIEDPLHDSSSASSRVFTMQEIRALLDEREVEEGEIIEQSNPSLMLSSTTPATMSWHINPINSSTPAPKPVDCQTEWDSGLDNYGVKELTMTWEWIWPREV